MILRKINQKIKQLKKVILNVVSECIEPFLWQEFTTSMIDDGRGSYKIYDNDLPSIRDLKAFMNMLSAIERSTESYSLYAVSLFKKLELPQEFLEFRRNYKVYMSTGSIITYYFDSAKEYTYKTLFPLVLRIINELQELCTSANLQKGAEFFIEQIISLEQYEQKYEKLKRQREKGVDEKADSREGFFTTLVKTNDHYLRKYYKEKYQTHFDADKSDEKSTKEKIWDYYPENIKESETIKQIKKISNGIIGIKKVLDDYAIYKKSGMVGGVFSLGSFILDLRKAYNYLQEFDYQAIIAEQAKPLAEYIKIQLKELNQTLQQIAVIADQFEAEGCLKETILLRHVDLLIKRYDQITDELKIPIDYRIQKRVYCQSRIESREKYLAELDNQIKDLASFLSFKDHPIINIPIAVRKKMQSFIAMYESDISMNRNNIAKYKKYLTEDYHEWDGLSFKDFISSHVEMMGNRWGLTIHSELMASLQKRKLYLEKQKMFLSDRLSNLKKFSEKNPYDYFVSADIKSQGYNKIVKEALKKHLDKLTKIKDALMYSNVDDSKAEIQKDVKSTPVEIKTKKEISERISNQIMMKTQELGILTIAIDQFDKSGDILNLLTFVRAENCLGIESLLLFEEIEEISRKFNKSPPVADIPSEAAKLSL